MTLDWAVVIAVPVSNGSWTVVVVAAVAAVNSRGSVIGQDSCMAVVIIIRHVGCGNDNHNSRVRFPF